VLAVQAWNTKSIQCTSLNTILVGQSENIVLTDVMLKTADNMNSRSMSFTYISSSSTHGNSRSVYCILNFITRFQRRIFLCQISKHLCKYF